MNIKVINETFRKVFSNSQEIKKALKNRKSLATCARRLISCTEINHDVLAQDQETEEEKDCAYDDYDPMYFHRKRKQEERNMSMNMNHEDTCSGCLSCLGLSWGDFI